jgi:hypothetical protein
MLQVLFTFSCLFFISQAHMSMQFPVPRNTKNGASYAVWQQNEPMIPNHPQVCHGLDKPSSVPSENKFTAGQEISVKLAGSAYHNGGHCAFWWTTNKDGYWYKIIDIKDCTMTAMSSGSFKVMIPKDMDKACETRCLFAWTWIPTSSGQCEIYSNCADIKVSGVSGVGSNPITLKLDDFCTGSKSCSRVSTSTHFSTALGTLKTSYSSDDGTPVNDPTKQETPSPTTSSSKMCTNPKAYGNNYPIDDSGRCLMNGGVYLRYKCDVGQCCSAAGYCGPDYDENAKKYINWGVDSTGKTYYASSELAFAEYCSEGYQADYRLVSC